MTFVCLEEWAKENVGGYATEQIYGMFEPFDTINLSNLFDLGFSRFQPIVEIGKCKFSGRFENTAKSKTELQQHANATLSSFIDLLNGFISKSSAEIFFLSGENNKFILKTEDALDFKLKYLNLSRVPDMLRTTIICPTIISLHDSIVSFINYCKDMQLSVRIVNFYDNVAKFGHIDKVDEDSAFGYVGVHVAVVLSVPGSSNDSIMAEIQFHPFTIYDGCETSVKETCHMAYKAFHTKEAQKDKDVAKRARAALLMYYAYALSVTPYDK